MYKVEVVNGVAYEVSGTERVFITEVDFDHDFSFEYDNGCYRHFVYDVDRYTAGKLPFIKTAFDIIYSKEH